MRDERAVRLQRAHAIAAAVDIQNDAVLVGRGRHDPLRGHPAGIDRGDGGAVGYGLSEGVHERSPLVERASGEVDATEQLLYLLELFTRHRYAPVRRFSARTRRSLLARTMICT